MPLAYRSQDKRRFSREEVCFRCEFAGPDFGPVIGLIVNISPLGCMVRCSAPVPSDARVQFALPVAGHIDGRVVWAVGGRMGIEFDEEIDAAPYLAMLDQLRRPGDEMGIY